MKLKIYSVYDNVAKAFTQPFYMVNDAIAMRAMGNCANNPEHNFGLNPRDYELHRIGEFNDEDASIDTTANEKLCNLASLVKKEEHK